MTSYTINAFTGEFDAIGSGSSAVSTVSGTPYQIQVTPTTGNAVASLTDGIYVGDPVVPPVGGIAVSGNIVNAILTASELVATDADKNLISIDNGSAAQVMTSNGSGELPSMQDIPILTIPYTDENSDFNAQNASGYFCYAPLTVSLPSSPSQGNEIQIFAIESPVIVQAFTGQYIVLADDSSTESGTATSTSIGCSIKLIYRSADSTWYSTSAVGSWTLG
jgi:hypothetical protein